MCYIMCIYICCMIYNICSFRIDSLKPRTVVRKLLVSSGEIE